MIPYTETYRLEYRTIGNSASTDILLYPERVNGYARHNVQSHGRGERGSQ